MDILSYLMGFKKGKASGGSSGGGGEADGIFWRQEPHIYFSGTMRNTFVFQDTLYVICTISSVQQLWKLNGEVWEYVCDSPSSDNNANSYATFFELNGKLHMLGGESTEHYVLDNETLTWTLLSTLPATHNVGRTSFVLNNEAYAFLCPTTSSCNVYKYNENSDAWDLVVSVGSLFPRGVVIMDGKAYVMDLTKNLYCFDGTTFSLVYDGINKNVSYITTLHTDGKALYTMPGSNYGTEYVMYKFVDGELVAGKTYPPCTGTTIQNMLDFNGRIHIVQKQVHVSCAFE